MVKRERYTPSDVGPSPLDWDTPYLKDISSLITNGFVGTATPFYTEEEGITYLYGTNVRENKIDLTGVRKITLEFHQKQSKTELQTGDLLTVQSGHIGATAVVPPELSGSNCHALIVSRLYQSKVEPYFLSYYLNSHIGKARMRGLEVGSTILHINTKDLKKFRVSLPPLPEQKKIARILSTWDRGIETVERLIANSKAQKKALMQQLLTGKRRFPGFEVEWRNKRLGQLCTIKTGKKDVNEGNAAGKYPFFTCAKEPTFSDVFSFDTEALLIAGNGAIGTTHYINGKFEAYQRTYVISEFHGCSARFLYHHIRFFFARDVEREKQHGAMPYIKLGLLKNYKVQLPDVHEQAEIVKVLDKLEKDEICWNSNHNLLTSQKKALMQQLLTGKRRVKVDEVTA